MFRKRSSTHLRGDGAIRHVELNVDGQKLRIAVEHLMTYGAEGAGFVFGPLANPKGSIGFVFAFVVLPTIIFVASIFAVLYYLGVMQWVVGACARMMGSSGV